MRDTKIDWKAHVDNVEFEVEGQTKKNPGVLVIRVDLSKDIGPSKSTKSTIIGTTHGNIKLDDYDMPDVSFSVNVYEPVKKKGGRK